MRTVQAKARPPASGAMRMANSQRLADPVGQMLDKVCAYLASRREGSDQTCRRENQMLHAYVKMR